MTAEREPSLRLFVAIELPDEWLEAFGRAQSDLREKIEKRGGPRLRWVRPEGIHLTLKFLGGVPESKLSSVRWALEQATGVAPDFRLVLRGLGAFGDRRGPRVVWVGVDGETVADREKVYRLTEDIETWFASAGFPREGRFQPHLTLARLPEDLKKEDRALVAEISAKVDLPQTSAMPVRRVSLMRSHLGPGGARYEPLGVFPA